LGGCVLYVNFCYGQQICVLIACIWASVSWLKKYTKFYKNQAQECIILVGGCM
jgi:hypothetical protein